MFDQANSRVGWLFGVLLLSQMAFGRCFDFSSSLDKMLVAVPKYGTHSLIKMSGQKADGVVWAAVRRRIDEPIRPILNKLFDHNTTRGSQVSEMDVTHLKESEFPDPEILALDKVNYEVTPFPLIHIEWTVEWAYRLIAGSAALPKEVLISYEKIRGTSHIVHLCGNILLNDVRRRRQTDVFYYEEVEATRRTKDATLNGLVATLDALEHAQDEVNEPHAANRHPEKGISPEDADNAP